MNTCSDDVITVICSSSDFLNNVFILRPWRSGLSALMIVELSILHCIRKSSHIAVESRFLVISMDAVLSLVLKLLGFL